MNIDNLKREIYLVVEQFNHKLQQIQNSQVALAKNQELLFQQQNKVIESIEILIQGLSAEDDEQTHARETGNA